MRAVWSLAFGAGLVACWGGGEADDADTIYEPPVLDFTYVVSTIDLPADEASALALGLDVDGRANDGVDNQLDRVLAAVQALDPAIDLEATLRRQLDHADNILLVNLHTHDIVNAAGVGLYFYIGADPQPTACIDASDPVCRHHLSGSAAFVLAAPAPLTGAVAGRIVNRKFTGGPGLTRVRLGVAGGVALELPLQKTKVELGAVQETTWERGKLAGAIAVSDLDSVVIPALAAMARLSAPSITDDQVATAVHGVPPDVDLDGNGTPDALSIGLGFEAVGASFVPEH